jgi:transposase-like protein
MTHKSRAAVLELLPGKRRHQRGQLCVEAKQCVLVIVCPDEYGRKELLAMTDGFRESTQSWREVLLNLNRHGLKQDPKLAIGDGALGF